MTDLGDFDEFDAGGSDGGETEPDATATESASANA